MRFYIVDNMGNVWGDFSTEAEAIAHLENYSKLQIYNYGLEIIEGK